MMHEPFDMYNTVEEFLLDNNFVSFVKEGDVESINSLCQLYSEKNKIIEEAVLLLRYVQVDLGTENIKQIDEDWDIIQERIRQAKSIKRRKRVMLLSTVSAIAACLAILIFMLSPIMQNDGEKEQLFSLLESAEMHRGEIQIIAGENRADVANNEIITQTEKGDVVVGVKEEINSSAITSEYVTLVVPKGKRITINLNDGSKVWVNSETKIAYPKVFSGNTREISVDGEIYLDVAKASKPFVVHTKGLDIKVLGTQFNVRAYGADSENSVVLVSGAVEIHRGLKSDKLQPNQGFFTVDGESELRDVDVSAYICWKDEIMILNGESLDVIFTRLGRHYGLEINCTERFRNERYIGKIDMRESIETVLSNISMSTKLNYTREEDRIHVE